MDGAAAMLLREPAFVLGCAVTAYGLNVALQTAGGLLLAAIADRASHELLVFIATAQLPIYTLPLIQRPLYRRWLSTSRSASALRPERGDA